MKDALTIYTLYDHPSDYPNEYVVRKWYVLAGSVQPDPELFLRHESLEEIRKTMAEKRLFKLTFSSLIQDEDKCILETYV